MSKSEEFPHPGFKDYYGSGRKATHEVAADHVDAGQAGGPPPDGIYLNVTAENIDRAINEAARRGKGSYCVRDINTRKVLKTNVID